MARTLLWVAILSYVGYKASWNILRRYLIRKTTVLHDIELLGKAPPTQKIPGTVVVAGRSLSGYASARILADYFEKIVLIDPDTNITAAGRVPQRPHLHVLLTISLPILRKLYTSFDKEAPQNDVYIFPGLRHWWIGRNYFGDLKLNMRDQITGSRISIETLCRRLTIAYCGDRLQVIHGTVTSIEASADKTTIRSVSYRPASEVSTTAPNAIPCTLFVDCSGASTIGAKLLPAACEKWGPYDRASYNPNVKYYSTSFSLTPKTQEKVSRALPQDDRSFGRWDTCTVIGAVTPTAETGRDLFMYQRIEGNRLLVGYCGWGVDTRPGTLAQYIETTRQMYRKSHPKERHDRDEWLFELLRLAGEGADNLDEPIKWDAYAMTSCYWIDYASKPVPNNFITVGDALMRVNPIFGQGVAKLLFNSIVLNTALHGALQSSNKPELPPGFAHSYFERVLRIDRGMFDTNRSLDYGYDSSVPQAGETLGAGKTFRKYWEMLLNFVSHDLSAYETFIDVLSGFRPGIDLMSPPFVFKSIFWAWWSPVAS
ncbi:uncharacterized protein EI90DRAFT_3079215 [Cantharellus anzutake]|uniref:uncharacterized protein n=1 Tax=Cantharellus anzutake TaxID=1750568 RepID=UPI0019074F18|nr:uncharacterized protein EI90DRAFT_3079215 [Cantharellus anzutake]KAF8321379.1 hypothetical protein EI90DRAFT_3079215 [Cantharellus anzutake]